MGALRAAATAAVAACGCGAAVAVGAWVEARAFVLKQVDVPVLEPGEADIRVLHISDIHLAPRQRLKYRYVAGLADLAPDLVINTGDNPGSDEGIDLVVEALDGLLDIPGAFVFGSNDYYAPSFRNPAGYLFKTSETPDAPVEMAWQHLAESLSGRGWLDLYNAAGVLSVAGRTVEVRGTGDAHIRCDNYAAVAGPLRADADLSIGVTHAPYRRVLDAMAADGLQVIFAGHTHGGQICLPTYRAIVNNCDLPLEYSSGLHTWRAGGRSSFLHVDAGIGTSPTAPIRLFCRPGATLLRLTARRD